MNQQIKPSHKRVVVTGSSGFVGKFLVEKLKTFKEFSVLPVARSFKTNFNEDTVLVADISKLTDWSEVLKDAELIVHAAARVHVMDETAVDALSEYRKVNVEGTIALAEQAAAAGVKRFIYISSIKVNGEHTNNREPFTADESPAPIDPYGISKKEAEDCLRDISSRTTMEVTIIRPVLVYGPGVRANFQTMMRWLSKGIILPFGNIRNKRSLVSIQNLCDFIYICLEHPCAAGETFLVSDGVDLSTSDLLKQTAEALSVKSILLPLPSQFLKLAAVILRRGDLSQRLCGSLQVSIEKNKRLLGWSPPITIKEALKITADDFLEREK
ncbi:UDP-glucose 4-epimerase family protein [Pseudomonas lundensis]|uniref:UDP-glucose 4-epimerase family protein n=1 Tax=Pseudomonas lundensis TaxID=86185 RepID=UPI00186628D6|nr:SDR family oxidoreductase [Pseudomonas lundensis]